MSGPIPGVNLRPFSLICEAHKNAVSAKVVQQCPDCYRLLAEARNRHTVAACPHCDEDGEVVMNSFYAGDQLCEEYGPCPYHDPAVEGEK